MAEAQEGSSSSSSWGAAEPSEMAERTSSTEARAGETARVRGIRWCVSRTGANSVRRAVRCSWGFGGVVDWRAARRGERQRGGGSGAESVGSGGDGRMGVGGDGGEVSGGVGGVMDMDGIGEAMFIGTATRSS